MSCLHSLWKLICYTRFYRTQVSVISVERSQGFLRLCVSHHESGVADVPRERHHGPLLRIHHGVLDDVRLTCLVGGQKLFSPSRHSTSFGQESAGNETIVHGHLPKDDVFSQDMVTVEKEREKESLDPTTRFGFYSTRASTSLVRPSPRLFDLGTLKTCSFGDKNVHLLHKVSHPLTDVMVHFTNIMTYF